jgi:DNA-binding NarL/FixJ family response regulator
MKPIRIVIVDEQRLFRNNLSDYFNTIPETKIVAETCNGEDAICLAGTYQPDVLLTDIQLPDLNGVTLIKEVTRNNSALRVLVLSQLVNEQDMWAVIHAGAHGYLLKDCSRPELLTAITSVAYGQIVFDSTIRDCVTSQIAPPPQPGIPDIENLTTKLTRREREVLILMGQGLNNCEIATQLFLSPKTVRNYASHLFEKLQVNTRAQAIVALHQMKK